MEKGRAIYATYAGKLGEDALTSLLTLPQAEFSYEPETLPGELPQVDKDLELVARELEGGTSEAHG
jgi:hypothetical protein